ncbi:MAG: site-specific integrase [Verrucomicrobiota bacterium]|nr:site-specific integrase [Verrucomicrobiota bacterium]
MKQFVFKQKSKVNGKTEIRRTYNGRYRLPGDTRDTQIALGVTDKRVAQQKLDRIVEKEQQRRAGMEVASFEGIQTPVTEALALFCEDLRTRQRSDKYIKDIERFVRIVSEHAKWRNLIDIKPDGFLSWRSANGNKAAKTLNEYLNAFNAFLNWLVQRETIPANPLAKIPKCETRGREKRVRRALSVDELKRLIAHAPGERALVYHAAAYTGLRRSELKSITWDDIELDSEYPRVVVQAKHTKNRKVATIDLHPDLVSKLKVRRADSPTLPVFDVPQRLHLLKKDLKDAGIAYRDQEGRQVDFHALRHTFGTLLHANGANQAIAMQAMRHSDPRLTAVTYNDSTLLPVANAIHGLPSLEDNPQCSPIRSPNLVAGGQNVSQPDAQQLRNKGCDSLEDKSQRLDLAQFDEECQMPAMAPAVGFEPTT